MTFFERKQLSTYKKAAVIIQQVGGPDVAVGYFHSCEEAAEALKRCPYWQTMRGQVYVRFDTPTEPVTGVNFDI